MLDPAARAHQRKLLGDLVVADLIPLQDTEGLFLASHVVPLASDDVDDRAADIIDAVDAALTVEGLVELNARSVDEQAPASSIAADWLAEHDLF